MLRICSTYCFSTAIMVAQMCLNITYVHCLPHQQRKSTLVNMHCYAEKICCLLKLSPKNMQSNVLPFKSQVSAENIGYLILEYSSRVNALVSTLDI